MGKKSTPSRSGKQQRTLRHGVHIELMMECIEESLSACQINALKKAESEYKSAMSKIRDAHRKEKEGTAIVVTQTRHGMPIPPVSIPAVLPAPQQQPQKPTRSLPQQQTQPQKVQPQQQPQPQKVQPQQQPQPQKVQQTGKTISARSESPDLIIVGETPPTKKPPQLQQQPQPNRLMVNQATPTLRNVVPQQVYKFVNIQGQAAQGFSQAQLIMRPVAPVVPQQQVISRPPNLVRMQYAPPAPQNRTVPQKDVSSTEVVMGTYGLGIKRTSEQDYGPAKKKKKPVETDESGNWVPLDEYYYGKKEGDPTYTEEKGEYRFKCWYCSKMLYNNIKAMMHLQGHIDSGKQHNLDLTDLTQCKHCYKQFDTPFEMQTHVEKVHMSNTNVLMCRICERDLDSRQALTSHMRQNHNACEMPYLCQLCNFRSSMYSDVVDHFKKKHDSSQNILCLYCLRIFRVKFVSQGWGNTQTYYGHLLKHQSKTAAKKCNLCRLTFFNPADVKSHKKKDHLPNHKGILGTVKHTSPGQLMIKVPDSGLHAKQQNLKSLNAPAVSKVLDFGGTKLPMLVNYLTCLECKTSMGTPDHFKKHIECSMCRFATSCSIAYANHMMGFHSGQMSSLNLNIPWERKMKCHLYCLCGFGSRYGNNIANHLVYCAKRTCYLQKPDIIPDDSMSDEDVDPRHKPGASILDVLGLVKKRTVSTKESVDRDMETEKNEIRRRARESSPPPKSPPPSVRRKPRDITPPPKSPPETQEENIPEELKGAKKWNTVKIKDTKEPSKASVFLGLSDETQEESMDTTDNSNFKEESSEISVPKESEEIKTDDKGDDKTQTSNENIIDKEDGVEKSSNDKDSGSDVEKLDDSLLDKTNNEPLEDDLDESKLNDSILEDDDSKTDEPMKDDDSKTDEPMKDDDSKTDEPMKDDDSKTDEPMKDISEKLDKSEDDLNKTKTLTDDNSQSSDNSSGDSSEKMNNDSFRVDDPREIDSKNTEDRLKQAPEKMELSENDIGEKLADPCLETNDDSLASSEGSTSASISCSQNTENKQKEESPEPIDSQEVESDSANIQVLETCDKVPVQENVLDNESSELVSAETKDDENNKSSEDDRKGDNDDENVDQKGDNDDENVDQKGDNDDENVDQKGDNDDENVDQKGDNDDENVDQKGDNDDENVDQKGDNDKNVDQKGDNEEENVERNRTEEKSSNSEDQSETCEKTIPQNKDNSAKESETKSDHVCDENQTEISDKQKSISKGGDSDETGWKDANKGLEEEECGTNEDSDEMTKTDKESHASSIMKQNTTEETKMSIVDVNDRKNVEEIHGRDDNSSKSKHEHKSPEKDCRGDRSKSREQGYEERKDYGSHSKSHDGRHYGDRSHDQKHDYHRSSDSYRHGDRSNDYNRSHDRDHYRDRDRDRYHERNYHRDDRNYRHGDNRHGGGYHGNQSHGGDRWNDRRDDYHNRNRGHDRYNQSGRGGYGYGGYHSNYR